MGQKIINFNANKITLNIKKIILSSTDDIQILIN